jgi:hypothetical protein
MACHHLGMSTDEFFRLTPRQFDLLMQQHRERVEYEEYMAGLLAATVANFSMGAPKKPLEPADFMPSRRQKARTKRERPPRQLIAQNIRCFLLGTIEAQKKAQGDSWTSGSAA